jgi:hypothetical protein
LAIRDVLEEGLGLVARSSRAGEELAAGNRG